ncbi:hypothetical protein DFH06DRAFT_1320304 [Mycena polygramma]|nr:hypothetical protein DFH06DRAFT_1320304 [Mycena polygramma]
MVDILQHPSLSSPFRLNQPSFYTPSLKPAITPPPLHISRRPRSNSSPPSLGQPELHARSPHLGILATPRVGEDPLVSCLTADYAATLEEERGLQGVREALYQRAELLVPATHDSVSSSAASVFSSDIAESLAQYYATDSSQLCDGFGSLRVVDVYQKLLDGFLQVPRPPFIGGEDGIGGEDDGLPQGEGAGAAPGDGAEAGPGGRGGGGVSQGAGGGSGDGAKAGPAGGAGAGPGDDTGEGLGRGRRGADREDGGQPALLNLFSRLEPIEIAVPPRTTPKVPRSYSLALQPSKRIERKAMCHDQALRVAQAIEGIHPNHPRFRFVNDDDDPALSNGTRGVLYHGTRRSALSSFRAAGVNPVAYLHRTFFSKGPSFNLADSVEQAVSHVLHGGPTVRTALRSTATRDAAPATPPSAQGNAAPATPRSTRSDAGPPTPPSTQGGAAPATPPSTRRSALATPQANRDNSLAPVDPIMVLAFEVELSAVYTATRTAYVEMEAPGGRLLNNRDTEWVNGNRAAGGTGPRPQNYDFVVGPFLTALPCLNGNDILQVSPAWVPGGSQPVHVAAVNERAWNLLNEALVHIYIERETEEAVLPRQS